MELRGVTDIGAEDIYGRYWPVDLFSRLKTQPASFYLLFLKKKKKLRIDRKSEARAGITEIVKPSLNMIPFVPSLGLISSSRTTGKVPVNMVLQRYIFPGVLFSGEEK